LGCSMPDVLYNVLGGRHYTAANTEAGRRAHYDQQVEYWRSRQPQTSDQYNR